MSFLKMFAELMKSEHRKDKSMKSKPRRWRIDETKCLGGDEVGRLRRVAVLVRDHGLVKNRFALVRLWFVVELGLWSGLRVDEMVNLQCADMLVDGEKSSLIVQNGKGGKRRAVWISNAFKRIYLEFLDYKRQLGFVMAPESYILCNRWGRRISTRMLQKEFKALLQKAGLPERYHVHSLRHTYTTFLIKVTNKDYRFAQIQLGHESMRTTQEYASVVECEARDSMENMYQEQNYPKSRKMDK